MNVRGCCDKSKRYDIDEELHHAKIELAVLQEVNVKGCKAETKHYDWTLSNREGLNNMRGLAILTKKGGKCKIRDIRDVDKNIMSAIVEYEEGSENWLVINVHAPNKNTHTFYATLGAYMNGNTRKKQNNNFGGLQCTNWFARCRGRRKKKIRKVYWAPENKRDWRIHDELFKDTLHDNNINEI